MAIIAILAMVTFANYKASSQQFALQRAVAKMAQDIRRVQAMAGQEESTCGSNFDYGYGIHINIKENDQDYDNKKYILFADCNGNTSYEPTGGNPDKIIIGGEIYLENKIIIDGVPTSSRKISIVFEPPDPTTFFDPGEVKDDPSVFINFGIDGGTQTKTLTVYKSGLIDY